MLRLNCPWCGTRDEVEFSFGGESHITRPSLDVSDAIWSDYLFNRENPKGIHHERWLHRYGCGRWFNVARDTVTHEVHAEYEMGAPKPEIPGKDSD
ncbi:MAG: sarcosine oxidase subunit delta [Gammaproteobacteria bacterium]|nr:sarcosine oxidase subunit delta [Gammaproteobacteria bacterium]